jgi:hypothetical protein
MAAPVKVSDRLLALAKKEAGSTHRSATAQIEHWATVHGLLERLVGDPDRESVKARIRASGGPLYVSDPARLGAVAVQASGVPTPAPTAAPRVVAARRKPARKRT